MLCQSNFTTGRGVLPRSYFLVPSSYQQKVSRPMPSHFPQRQNLPQFPEITHEDRLLRLDKDRSILTPSIHDPRRLQRVGVCKSVPAQCSELKILWRLRLHEVSVLFPLK